MMKKMSSFVGTLLLIQIFIFSDSTSSQIYDCNPVERCRSASEGYLVPDPEDCYSYYICLEDSHGNMFPSDNSVKCENGYYFNPSYNHCDYNYNSTCENKCVNLCQSDCTDYNFEKVADFKDCSSFYVCLPGGTMAHHKCPDRKPYFDGSKCSKEKYVCCDCCDECTPYCEDSYSEIADPYDCRSYFLCLDTGFPSLDKRYTCQEGEYFDASLGRCEPEHDWHKCKPICGNSTSSD